MPTKRATKAEMRARVDEVYTMLLNGLSRRKIVSEAAKKWSIASSTTDVLIQRANELFLKDAEPLRMIELGKAIRRYERCIEIAMSAKDVRPVISAQKELSTLLGHYEHTQTIKIIREAGITPELIEAMAQLTLASKAANIDTGQLFDDMMSAIAQAKAEHEQQRD